MAHFVVEFELTTPIGAEASARDVSVLRPCREVRNVKRMGSVVSADHSRGLRWFEALDAETLREPFRSRHVPLHSVWPVHSSDFAPPGPG
jgi:hypothetical protein